MKIIEPGHVYELDQVDAQPGDHPVVLRFVNREPGTEHPGTQTQEVLRALIDRTLHCDACLRWPGNDLIVQYLRMALVLHEARALERKTEKGLLQPEHVPTGPDGHFELARPSAKHSQACVSYRAHAARVGGQMASCVEGCPQA